MEENNNNYLIIAGIAIVVVIALAIIIPHIKKTTPDTVDVGASSAVPGLVTPVTTVTPATTSSGVSAYNATLKQYAGKTVTFAADCTASPITQNLAKDTMFLLVNNSTVSHVITVGTTSYTVSGYHYKPVYFSASGTVVINCDNKQDVANVGVQQ